jgi:hypothetical protein
VKFKYETAADIYKAKAYPALDPASADQTASKVIADMSDRFFLAYDTDELRRLGTLAKSVKSLAAEIVDNPADKDKREEYKLALRKLAVEANNLADDKLSYKFAFSPSLIKDDPILSKVELKKLNDQIKDSTPARDGGMKVPSASDLEQMIKNSPAPAATSVPKGWTIQSDWDSYQEELEKQKLDAWRLSSYLSYEDPQVSDAAARRLILSKYWDRFRLKYDPAASTKIVSPNGTVLKVTRRASSNKPVAQPEDILATAETIDLVFSKINMPANTKYSLVSSGTSRQKPNVLGYANAIAGGHTIVDRVRKAEKRDSSEKPKFVEDESWHSTDTYKRPGDYFRHTAAHELGHVVAFEVWSSESQMNQEYAALRKQQISKYGKESTHEHFAEAFAKYVLTGKATPEFLDLLRSKNLLKSQRND